MTRHDPCADPLTPEWRRRVDAARNVPPIPARHRVRPPSESTPKPQQDQPE